MEYKLNRDILPTVQLIFDGCQEQPVDLDFSLPDYCPDIQKILKCQVYPSINNRSIMGDSLEVDGKATVKLMYLDAAGTDLQYYENSRPFTASIPLGKSVENATSTVTTRVEYINCRATSPRHLDVHGAFSVCAKVSAPVEQEVICGIEGDDVQQKFLELPTSRVTGTSQQQFTVSEVVEIGNGKPEVETIIHTSVSVQTESYKVVSNKIIVKGITTTKVLYCADPAELECMKYDIPFSQIIDCAGITEDDLCCLNIDVCHFDVQPKRDSSGENTLLEIDIKLWANIIACQPSNVSVVTDAYSTKYELNAEYQPNSFLQLIDVFQESSSPKTTLELGDSGISRVVDIWNEISSVETVQENEQIILNGKLNLCLLACNQSGHLFYQERMMDFQCSYEKAKYPAGVKCQTKLCVEDLSFRISGDNKLDVKADLRFEISVWKQTTCQSIVSAASDETQPRNTDDPASLIIYYAAKGESLWTIARIYCTSTQAIQAENDLTEDLIPENMMILIPV